MSKHENVCAFFRAIDIIALDYPWQAAIMNALEVADHAIVVCATNSRDNTVAQVNQLAEELNDGRITIVETSIDITNENWQVDWFNLCLQYMPPDYDWVLVQDLDELIAQPAQVRATLQQYGAQIGLIRFNWTHIYGTSAFQRMGWTPQQTRLGRLSKGFSMHNMKTEEDPHGCVCALRFGPWRNCVHLYQGPGIVNANTALLHYGWCRDPQALAESQHRHKVWYGISHKQVAYYDFQLGKLLAEGLVRPYRSGHPSMLSMWFFQHEDVWNWVYSTLDDTTQYRLQHIGG